MRRREWPTWRAGATGIVFLGDEQSVPGQQGIRTDETGELVQSRATEAFAFAGQSSSLIRIEPRLFTQLFFKNVNLLLEIRDDVLLIAAHPTSDRNKEQGERIHGENIPR